MIDYSVDVVATMSSSRYEQKTGADFRHIQSEEKKNWLREVWNRQG